VFERYTESARRAIFFARQEAVQAGSNTIETEHLLLGIFRSDTALLRLLTGLPDTEKKIRQSIEAGSTAPQTPSTSIDLPLSKECKQALRHAAEEAERWGYTGKTHTGWRSALSRIEGWVGVWVEHGSVRPEHLLVGLLRVEDCAAAKILGEYAITLASVRETITKRNSQAFAIEEQLAGRSYRYIHLDVFTDRLLEGNQLAVFLEADGLTPDLMQRIALEMAFPETTFVVSSDGTGVDAQVRIFTPRRELPMAGHPTIGTTFALAQDGRLSNSLSEIVLGLGVGPTRVQLEWEGDRLRFAWMVQRLPEFGAKPHDVQSLATALGLREADIRDTGLPVQEISSGVPFLFVPLASRQAVDSVVVDQQGLTRFYTSMRLPDLPVFVFSTESGDDDATVYSRMFAPASGVPEDPATGGASGPLGVYLVQYAAVHVEAVTRIVSVQGVKMGRPSRIYVSVATQGGAITEVLVGGNAVIAGVGQIVVPDVQAQRGRLPATGE
jgi:trans-2,3-dihydro-3-hydroxyanthranilate isomerase